MVDENSSHGETKSFEDGALIYRQNAEPTGVYMILTGEVEIWHEHAGEMTLIATIGEGELLGEVSAIENEPHSVTAKAKGGVTSLFIPVAAFRKTFSDPLVRRVVHTLASRLKSSYTTAPMDAASWRQHDADGRPDNVVCLEAGSRIVAECLLTFVEIKEFPFSVGAFASATHQSVVNASHMKVPLGHLAEMSDPHFELLQRDGALWIRDMGSAQGTIVNGEALSRYAMTATAKLTTGENTIIAGGAESPVRFIITVPDKP